MSESLNKAIAAGLILVIVFTALAHGVVEPWSVLIFELMAAALLLMWVVQAVIDKRLTLFVARTVWPLVGLIALGLMQSLAWEDGAGNRQSISFDVEATRGTTMILCCLLAYVLLAGNFLTGRERLRALSSFLVYFGCCLGIFGLVQHFAWNGSIYWLRPTRLAPFGPFFNRDHFAGYLELFALLPVALIATRAVRGDRILLYGAAAMMMGIAIVFSLSRAGMLSLLAQMIFLATMSFVHYRNLGREAGFNNAQLGGREKTEPPKILKQVPFFSRFFQSLRLFKPLSLRPLPESLPGRITGIAAVVATMAAIGVGVIWIGAAPIINRIATGDPKSSDLKTAQRFRDIRGQIWEDSWAVIRRRPLTGVGLGAFETAYPIYASDNGLDGIVAEAHNDYLQILADAGVIGGALAVWFVTAIFRASVRAVRSRDRLFAGIALGSATGLFGLLVHSVFDFNLHLPSHATLFLIYSALVSSIATMTDEAALASRQVTHVAPGLVREVSL